MAILSSSPLNLTLDSSPTATVGKVGVYGPGINIQSLFNSPRKNTILWTPWPTGKITSGSSASSTVFFSSKPTGRQQIHSDDIYNISTTSIIDYTQNIKNSYNNTGDWYPMWLKPMDFAYLKDVGVYPNNRLVICRRFDGPVDSDLTLVEDEPISTMITWIPEGKDFIDFSFGENWTEAEATLVNIFNNAGGDFNMGAGSGIEKFGEWLKSGMNAVPLPGFSELLQRQIMDSLGILDNKNGDASTIPSGDPNLIKEAKQRKTIDIHQAGSGLHCDVSIELECKWEQKFINGIDPTLAWMDILQTVLRFGTSPARFYLGSGGQQSQKLEAFLTSLQNNPISAISDLVSKIIDSLNKLSSKVVDYVKGVLENPGKAVDSAGSAIKNIINTSVITMIDKYKVKIIGVFKALTGSSSGPWHVTIGNPKRPTFCSGDMICDKVQITMGDKLAFNDLPSSVTAKFTLKNARPLGMQEILARFNSGYARTVTVRKTIEDAQTDMDTKQSDGDHEPVTGFTNGISQKISSTPTVQSSGSGQNNNTPNTISNPSAIYVGNAAKQIALQNGPVGTRVGSQEVNNYVCNSDANSNESITTDSVLKQSISVSPDQKLSTFDTGSLIPKSYQTPSA